eukprot:6277620-Amphidinium_carterae.1
MSHHISVHFVSMLQSASTTKLIISSSNLCLSAQSVLDSMFDDAFAILCAPVTSSASVDFGYQPEVLLHAAFSFVPKTLQ